MRRSAAAVPRPAIRRTAYCLPGAAAPRARRRWRNALTRRQVQPAVLVVASLGERRAVRGALPIAADGEARKSRCSRRAHAGWCSRTLCCCPALPTRPANGLKGGGAAPRHTLSSTSSRKPALLWLERVACVWRRYCAWPSSPLLHFRWL